MTIPAIPPLAFHAATRPETVFVACPRPEGPLVGLGVIIGTHRSGSRVVNVRVRLAGGGLAAVPPEWLCDATNVAERRCLPRVSIPLSSDSPLPAPERAGGEP